jgi:hypothetical protein
MEGRFCANYWGITPAWSLTMTEDPRLGRIDLRVLDDARATPNPDVLARIVIARSDRFPNARARDDLQRLRRYVRPALLAAGVLVAMAIGAVRTTSLESARATPITTIAGWTESHHLPSNGELLVAFEGYGR